MSYTINPAAFSAVFTVPCDVADKHLKLATASQLKVLIYVMRNLSCGINAENCAEALSLPLSEVEDALLFWSQCNLLIGEAPKVEEPIKTPVITTEMPTRADVIRRGMEDERVALLMREAQLKFGRGLKQNESSLLVALYDDEGMDVSLILMLLQYATSNGKCNISFIKSTAVKWIKAGVQTVADAERLIAKEAEDMLCWSIVERVFGIERRKPSTKELELSALWVNQWKVSEEMLKAAYDECVNQKTKLNMPYIAKIIENWNKKGYKSPEDIKNDTKPKATGGKNDFAGYDLDLVEQMLNKY